jgi:hypothetical protein
MVISASDLFKTYNGQIKPNLNPVFFLTISQLLDSYPNQRT